MITVNLYYIIDHVYIYIYTHIFLQYSMIHSVVGFILASFTLAHTKEAHLAHCCIASQLIPEWPRPFSCFDWSLPLASCAGRDSCIGGVRSSLNQTTKDYKSSFLDQLININQKNIRTNIISSQSFLRSLMRRSTMSPFTHPAFGSGNSLADCFL